MVLHNLSLTQDQEVRVRVRCRGRLFYQLLRLSHLELDEGRVRAHRQW